MNIRTISLAALLMMLIASIARSAESLLPPLPDTFDAQSAEQTVIDTSEPLPKADALPEAEPQPAQSAGNTSDVAAAMLAPLAELAAREKLRFEAPARAADLEPLASCTFVLRYPRAEEVRNALRLRQPAVLSKRGSAMADPRTNLLFVTDLDARVRQISDLIAMLDKAMPQVMIEVKILEDEADLSRNLGVKLGVAPQSDPATGLASGKDGVVVYDLLAGPINGFDAATAGLTLFVAQATRLLNK